MRAPSFRCTETDGSLILHYYSDRPGLEHIVIGIVKVRYSSINVCNLDSSWDKLYYIIDLPVTDWYRFPTLVCPRRWPPNCTESKWRWKWSGERAMSLNCQIVNWGRQQTPRDAWSEPGRRQANRIGPRLRIRCSRRQHLRPSLPTTQNVMVIIQLNRQLMERLFEESCGRITRNWLDKRWGREGGTRKSMLIYSLD